jgi:glycosyltransferase involved in cell wall biosynthesis
MIVKNESSIIKETLKLLTSKVKIDYYVICDTGSTDNTIEIIKSFFSENDVDGEIYLHEWKNFGHNRTLALQHAKNKCDYTFVFDADDYIVGNLDLSNLTSDSYMLKFGNNHHSYQRKVIVKSNLDWKFVGVLHECITCDSPTSQQQLLGDYYIVSGRTSSRNKNPNKYLDDIKILEEGFVDSLITNDGLHSRYSYYCANSCFDAGLKEKSIKWYKKTLTLNGWFDEKYNSCLKLYEIIQDESRFYYLVKSFTFNPNRVEGILELIKHYTCEKNYDVAWNFYLLVKNYQEHNIAQITAKRQPSC